MTRKLYGDLRSPGVRGVLLTAKALDIDVEVIPIDIHKNEHLTTEFKKMNPQCTIPTLDDNGFIIWESHSIMVYLVEKYRKTSSLYPEDVQKRAHVNKLLHFNSGDFLVTYHQVGRIIISEKLNQVPKDLQEKLLKQYDLLEMFLNHTKCIANDELTLADFSIWTSLTNSSAVVPVDENKYPKLSAWVKLLENLPYANVNTEGGIMAKKVFDEILKK